MKNLTVKLASLSPMLQNPLTKETLQELLTGVRLAKQKDRPLEEICKEKLYKSDDNKLGIPAQNLLSALMEAGRDVKNGKKAVSTATSTSLPSFLTIEGEFLPFTNNPKWEPDLRGGTLDNGKAKVKVAIVRPKFKYWELTVRMQYDEKIADESVVKDLIRIAGNKIGLGDFRPAKRGVFGRFAIADFKVEKTA